MSRRGIGEFTVRIQQNPLNKVSCYTYLLQRTVLSLHQYSFHSKALREKTGNHPFLPMWFHSMNRDFYRNLYFSKFLFRVHQFHWLSQDNESVHCASFYWFQETLWLIFALFSSFNFVFTELFSRILFQYHCTTSMQFFQAEIQYPQWIEKRRIKATSHKDVLNILWKQPIDECKNRHQYSIIAILVSVFTCKVIETNPHYTFNMHISYNHTVMSSVK